MNNSHPGRMALESLLAGEATASTPALERHLSECAECRERYQRLCSEQKDFLMAHPYTSMKTRPVKVAFARIGYRMAAGLVILFSAVVLMKTKFQEPVNRIKGNSGILLFVQDTLGQPVLQKSPVCHPGEKIQFAYSCAADSEFALLGIDGAGHVTIYFPGSGDESQSLAKGQGIPLPKSILLDDYLGNEYYFALFSGNRFNVRDWVRALQLQFQQQGALEKIELTAPEGFSIHRMEIRKERKR